MANVLLLGCRTKSNSNFEIAPKNVVMGLEVLPCTSLYSLPARNQWTLCRGSPFALAEDAVPGSAMLWDGDGGLTKAGSHFMRSHFETKTLHSNAGV